MGADQVKEIHPLNTQKDKYTHISIMKRWIKEHWVRFHTIIDPLWLHALWFWYEVLPRHLKKKKELQEDHKPPWLDSLLRWLPHVCAAVLWPSWLLIKGHLITRTFNTVIKVETIQHRDCSVPLAHWGFCSWRDFLFSCSQPSGKWDNGWAAVHHLRMKPTGRLNARVVILLDIAHALVCPGSRFTLGWFISSVVTLWRRKRPSQIEPFQDPIIKGAPCNLHWTSPAFHILHHTILQRVDIFARWLSAWTLHDTTKRTSGES